MSKREKALADLAKTMDDEEARLIAQEVCLASAGTGESISSFKITERAHAKRARFRPLPIDAFENERRLTNRGLDRSYFRPGSVCRSLFLLSWKPRRLDFAGRSGEIKIGPLDIARISKAKEHYLSIAISKQPDDGHTSGGLEDLDRLPQSLGSL
jgi:hypothetical protein